MKKTLVIILTFIIFTFSLITPCFAFNGQMSYDGGYAYYSNNDVGLRFGGNTYDRPYTALVNDEGLTFSIQIPPQNSSSLYLVPISGDYYATYSDILLADYIETLAYNNILPADVHYGNGEHTIYIGNYTSNYGNYKLCLYDETLHDIYELYFYYIPSVQGSYFAVKFDRTDVAARIRTFSGNSLLQSSGDLDFSDDDDFSYLGELTPNSGDSILSVSLTLGTWESTPTSDFYILNIPFISFHWWNDTLFDNQKCNWCSVSVVNNSKKTLYHVGTINNVTSYDDTNLNTNKGYSFFVPSNFTDIGDTITLQLDFQFENKDYSIDWFVRVRGISFVAWNLKELDLGGKYNTLDEFLKAQEEYDNYFSDLQIDINDIDLDIDSYIGEDSIVKAFSFGNKILSLELFFTILLITFSIAIGSYIFFGKK